MTIDEQDPQQERYAERWSDPEVETALAEIQPDAELREIACDRFVETILHAHELAPDRWGVTDGRSFIRLNVGPAEAVLIDDFGIRIMVHEPTALEDELADILELLESTPAGRFRSVPESVYTTLPWSLGAERLEQGLDILHGAHAAHIEVAARSGLNGMTRRGHHPGIVDAIGAELGVALPQPGFVRIKPPSGRRPAQVPAAANQRTTAIEGRRVEVTLTRVERSRKLRSACLEHYGTRCVACGLDLGETYGAEVAGVIHVHHLRPAADGERETDPIRDLRPVCPTCHLVIHTGGTLRTIEEVRSMLQRAGRQGHA